MTDETDVRGADHESALESTVARILQFRRPTARIIDSPKPDEQPSRDELCRELFGHMLTDHAADLANSDQAIQVAIQSIDSMRSMPNVRFGGMPADAIVSELQSMHRINERRRDTLERIRQMLDCLHFDYDEQEAKRILAIFGHSEDPEDGA